MYRIGKKQKRAILTANGNEVVVFPKGKEALAEKVCNLLNADLEVNKISSNGMLAVSLPSDELIKYIIPIRDNAFKKADDEYFKGQLIACDSIIVFINMLKQK